MIKKQTEEHLVLKTFRNNNDLQIRFVGVTRSAPVTDIIPFDIVLSSKISLGTSSHCFTF